MYIYIQLYIYMYIYIYIYIYIFIRPPLMVRVRPFPQALTVRAAPGPSAGGVRPLYRRRQAPLRQ